MTSALRIDAADSRPIWRQIEEGIRNLVASGALLPSASVPSVRDLARGLAVNPATVAKAYQRLADAGVLTVRRGDGTYVAASPPAISGEQRGERLRAEALRYASFAVTLGASSQEAEAALAEAWRALADPPAAIPPPVAGKQDAASPAPGAGDTKGAKGGFT